MTGRAEAATGAGAPVLDCRSNGSIHPAPAHLQDEAAPGLDGSSVFLGEDYVRKIASGGGTRLVARREAGWGRER